PIRPGAVYVFDKGYCSLSLWQKIHDTGAVFVTRPKSNAAFETIGMNDIHPSEDANIIADEIVCHRSKNTWRGTLDFHIRRLTVRRDDGKLLQIVTNDLTRSASDIAALYRQRWQIELLFRWIKQHLKIRRFLGRSENAVKLQIYAALIAYLLLRLAARLAKREDIQPIRFAELAAASLFLRKAIENIDKPIFCRRQTQSYDPQQMSLKLK
ncbi:MAG: IS4 family transposase, partial [Hyphomonas sp.]